VAYYDEVDNRCKVESVGSFNSSAVAPEFPTSRSFTIGGGALLVGNAVTGKGQGMWNSYLTDPTLNITTPYLHIKAGTYT
ncbi:WxL domain-containing protein, partial [Enterococcus faecalis]